MENTSLRIRVPYFESFLYYRVVKVLSKGPRHWKVMIEKGNNTSITDVRVENIEPTL